MARGRAPAPSRVRRRAFLASRAHSEQRAAVSLRRRRLPRPRPLAKASNADWLGGLGAASARAGRSGERKRADHSRACDRRAALRSVGVISAALAWPQCVGADPGRVALPLLRRRSGGGPDPPGGGLGAASARAGRSGERKRAHHSRACDRRAALRPVGVISASASLVPAPWGGPGAGSRYHCSAVAAAEVRTRQAAGSGGRFGPGGPKRRGRGRPPFRSPRPAGCFAFSGGHFCERLLVPSALGRTRGRIALPLLRRRSGGGPDPPGGGLGAASARAGRSGEGDCAHHSGACDRRAALRSVGVVSASACLAPVRWGGPEAGSRYHCSAVAAAELRSRLAADAGPGRATNAPSPARRRPPLALSRRAAGSGPLRPGRAEAARESAPTIPEPATGGLLCVRRGSFLRALPWSQRLGADPRPGRATTAPPSQRRSSGPAGRRARRRFGPGGPKRRGRLRPPFRSPRPAGCFALGGGHFCSACLAPVRWGGPEAGSRYHCSAVAAAELRSRLAADAGPGRATNAPSPARRRPPLALSRQAAGSRPLRPGRAEAVRESAPTIPEPSTGGLVCAQWGSFLQRLLGPSALGRTRAGSRYHCSAVAAAELRTRRAAGSGPLRRAAEAAREGAPTIPEPATGGLVCAQWGSFLRALPWPRCVGADPRPGRATTAPPSQRRSSGPAGWRARRRFGPGGPKRGGRLRPPFRSPRPAGCFALGGGHFCERLLVPSALGRTRGRVALPLLRRRSGGGPDPPGGGLGAASARAGRSGERKRAPLPIPRGAAVFCFAGVMSGGAYLARAPRDRPPRPGRSPNARPSQRRQRWQHLRSVPRGGRRGDVKVTRRPRRAVRGRFVARRGGLCRSSRQAQRRGPRHEAP